MKAYELTKDIYWVGGLDYNCRSFHGYYTSRGVTYNAYLIMDEHITLVDTVKASFTEEMLERIASVVDPAKIEYIVSNHAEFDHSGAISVVSKLCPNAKIISSAPVGVRTLTNLYGDLPIVGVKAGDTLNIGKRTLKFLPTPMVHWPDNMITYSEYDSMLFSNDAFGQHLACSERLDTTTDLAIALSEAKKYYCNIVLPYAAQTAKALEAVKNLSIKMIAPSHGIVWTKYIPQIIKMYEDLSGAKKQNTAVIVYDTMWGNTETLAKSVGCTFESVCDKVIYYNLQYNHISDIITDVATSKYLAVGSPTLNNNMLPSVAGFLYYLKGLNPTGLSYVAFGSCGWAGGALKQISDILDGMNYHKLTEPLQLNFKPTKGQLEQIESDLKEKIK